MRRTECKVIKRTKKEGDTCVGASEDNSKLTFSYILMCRKINMTVATVFIMHLFIFLPFASDFGLLTESDIKHT